MGSDLPAPSTACTKVGSDTLGLIYETNARPKIVVSMQKLELIFIDDQISCQVLAHVQSSDELYLSHTQLYRV